MEKETSASIPRAKALGDVRGLVNQEDPEGKTMYAVYNYLTNRPITLSSSLSEADTSVSQFLSNQARTNEDFSLEVLTTSAPVEQEQLLRSALVTSLSKGTIYAGSGNIILLDSLTGSAIESGVVCYFCIIRETEKQSQSQDANQSVLDDSYCASDYVICLTKEGSIADIKDELELFKAELDSFCVKVARNELLEICQHKEEAAGGGRMHAELSNWHARTIEYLPQCVNRISSHLAEVIHAALLGQTVTVVGGDDLFRQDMLELMDLLSLSQLVHRPPKLLRDELSPTLQLYLEPPEEAVLTLKENGTTEFTSPIEMEDSFCKSWAKAMLSSSTNAIDLKNIVLEQGRKVIQEVNTMKKLMSQAETNHYALYNANKYLSVCNTPAKALLCNIVNTTLPSGDDATDVLSALLEYQLNVSKHK